MKPNKEFNVNLLVTSIEKGKPSMSEPMEDKSLGMTLRDYFAAKAMHGAFISGYNLWSQDLNKTASKAYEMADAMLKARQG